MADNLLRVGVVGCGSIFDTHFRAYLEHPSAVLTAFYDRVEARARAQLKRIQAITNWMRDDAREENEADIVERCKFILDNMQLFTSLDKLLDNVEIIDICAPNAYHIPYSIMALERGVNVMTEKPPARNYIETKQLLEVAAKSKAKFQLNENVYWANRTIDMGKLVREGKVGQVLKVETLLGHGGPSWGWNNFFMNPMLSGGGALVDMGPHSTAMALGALGYGTVIEKPEFEILKISSLKCKGGTKKLRTVEDADGLNKIEMTKFMFEDDVKYRAWIKSDLAAKDAIIVTVSTSWAQNMASATVEGTEGTLGLELDENKHVIIAFYPKHGGDKEVYKISPQARDEHELECIDFCTRVANQEQSKVDETFAHQMMILLSGTYLSNRLGDRVEVTPKQLDEYVQGFEKYPRDIMVDEIVWDLMAPFTSDYFEEKDLSLF